MDPRAHTLHLLACAGCASQHPPTSAPPTCLLFLTHPSSRRALPPFLVLIITYMATPAQELKSTPAHRAYTYGSMALMGATLAQGLSGVHTAGDWVGVSAALAAAYVLSDLGTGALQWLAQ